jgi:Lrp/AsnC family transcriptional regulator for asnA, asnC and gidA
MSAISKNTNDELDEIDHQIIAILQRDGRASYRQIAQALKVSPGKIRYRYEHLVQLGALRVMAITNPLRMGYKKMALIGIKVEGDQMMKVAKRIAELEEVVYLIVVSGTYDIFAEIVCREQDNLLQFLTDRLYKIDGVRDCESFMHLKIIKEVYF